jgi:formylglycine-generating enzyme required for sulfatase activity
VQKRIAVVFVTFAAVLVASSISRAQSSDPWIGTWKVNLEKSTYSPGPPPTVAATVKIEPSAGGIKTTIDATNAEGKPTHTETVAKFDGKDNPVTGAQAPNTTNALKRIDDRTFEVMGKVDGKPAVTTRVAVSTDGKTMTATQTGMNAQGQSVNNVIVLNKQ